MGRLRTHKKSKGQKWVHIYVWYINMNKKGEKSRTRKKLKTSEVELIPTQDPIHKFRHKNQYL